MRKVKEITEDIDFDMVNVESEHGCLYALYKLVFCYKEGIRVKRDKEKAKKLGSEIDRRALEQLDGIMLRPEDDI